MYHWQVLGVWFMMMLSRIACFSIRSSRFSGSRLFSYGANMDQNQLMETDQLVVVDEQDRVVVDKQLTKKGGHTFNTQTPRATLHRAFSFFLFDQNDRMLLTQRASDKITFPNVWTNTCCSHPLQGMTPKEVDDPVTDYPNFPGIKQAAVRKMKHELGVDPEYLPLQDIVFLTRFHYWASDTVTYGKDAPWGEHEVDYILFLKAKGEIPLDNVNPEEVQDYKWLTVDELKAMTKQEGLLWSPWFRGIMDRGGWDWCADVDGSLTGKYTNKDIIFFDPPEAHYANYNLKSHDKLTGVLSAVNQL